MQEIRMTEAPFSISSMRQYHAFYLNDQVKKDKKSCPQA